MGGAIPKPLRRSRPTPAPTPTPTPVISPTAPEVSQATATSMDGYDSRKTKAKGRSSTIMTSSRGVEEEAETEKKTLLGS